MARPPTPLADRLSIAALAARGHSEAQIAAALGLTPAACKQSLSDARAVLEASAVTLAGDYLTASDVAARKGDHRPARDLLDRLHVTEPTADSTTNVGIAVSISGFTLPGLPVQVDTTGALAMRTLSTRPDSLTESRSTPQGAPAPAIDAQLMPARPQETSE